MPAYSQRKLRESAARGRAKTTPGFFGALKDATSAAISAFAPRSIVERPAVIEAETNRNDAKKRQHRTYGNTP